jgi:tRNA(adenine34) deaminase
MSHGGDYSIQAGFSEGIDHGFPCPWLSPYSNAFYPCYNFGVVDDEFWMALALEEARLAPEHGDVPIGALVVREGEIIGRGHNRREIDHDPTAHAEVLALRAASQVIGHWRLEHVTLYCTLEPCAMCAGAMVLARLPRLVYATEDPKAGAGGSVMDLLNHSSLNHQVEVRGGVLRDQAAAEIVAFFANLRAQGQKGRPVRS